jgi:hypothetical protein
MILFIPTVLREPAKKRICIINYQQKYLHILFHTSGVATRPTFF